MCFYGHSPAKVAEEDIECFKRMTYDGKHLFSIYWNQTIPYSFGSSIVPSIPFKPEFAFSDLLYKKKTRNERQVARALKRLNSKSSLGGEVVHSYSSYAVAQYNKWVTEVIVKCIIPKGTIYWEDGLAGEYASLSVKLIDFC